LVVVLGHSQCGAVIAVVEGAKLPGNLGPLLAPIKPAVSKAREEHPGAAAEALIDAAIRNNVFQAMEDVLRLSPAIKGRVKAGEVKLMGAFYEMDTGEVKWLGPHPDQEKLLSGKAPVKAGKKGKEPKE
jgi:carbonic anhydrase